MQQICLICLFSKPPLSRKYRKWCWIHSYQNFLTREMCNISSPKAASEMQISIGFCKSLQYEWNALLCNAHLSTYCRCTAPLVNETYKSGRPWSHRSWHLGAVNTRQLANKQVCFYTGKTWAGPWSIETNQWVAWRNDERWQAVDCGKAAQWKVGMKWEFLQDKGTGVGKRSDVDC